MLSPGPRGVPFVAVGGQRPVIDRGLLASPLLRQFLVFAAVGLVGTAAHFVVLYTLVTHAGLGPVVGSSFGFLVGALVNYWLNYQLTFRSNKRHGEALPRFLAVAGGGWLLNAVLMAVLLSLLDLHYLLVQVAVTGVVLVWNFVANRFWTFAEC